MAQTIVDSLQPVDVGEDDTDRIGTSPTEAEEPFGRGMEGTMVRQAGERVGHGKGRVEDLALDESTQIAQREFIVRAECPRCDIEDTDRAHWLTVRRIDRDSGVEADVRFGRHGGNRREPGIEMSVGNHE